MFLKYNVKKNKYETKIISTSSINTTDGDITGIKIITVTTTNVHNLKNGDKIIMTYTYDNTEHNDEYDIFNVTNYEFSFYFQEKKPLLLRKIYENNNRHFVEQIEGVNLSDNDVINVEHNGSYYNLNHIDNNFYYILSDNLSAINYDAYFYYQISNVDNIIIDTGLTISHYINSVYIPLYIPSKNDINLYNEYNATMYFEEKKKEIIPEIIDYEKKCFAPYFYNNTNLNPLYNISFKLFLRERDDLDTFKLDNQKNWNQSYETVSTAGDSLKDIGFTIEDIRYQKLKLQKSFLRLTFYDNKDPFTQTLLYYSTIFFDTGDLYNKYIKGEEESLTCEFKVTDRFNQTKSSEGFYLYLFPDFIEGTGRTIYMRAEFNHAGYGKTIPLMSPKTDDNYTIDFGNNFPQYLMNENSDNNVLLKYFDYLHIPITLKYDSDKDEYLYYFNTQPTNATNSSFKVENNEMVINLYEPKLNEI